MTDQERQQLIILLENYKGYDRELNKLVHDAADEIERLAADNNRLKQERDAWEQSCRSMGWMDGSQ